MSNHEQAPILPVREREPASVACLVSSAIVGVDPRPVTVEASLSGGKRDRISVVGLARGAAGEAKRRVKEAILNSGFDFPHGEVVINLSPAELEKTNSLYELPIALTILAAYGEIPKNNLEGTVALGEFSLTGEIKHVNGVLLSLLMAKKQGFSRVLIPEADYVEASVIKNFNSGTDLEIIPVKNLRQAVGFLAGRINIKAPEVVIPKSEWQIEVDFAEVKGQEHIKVALEVAAAGGHNVLMFGPPGSGKTMMAKALAGILPPLNDEQIWDVATISSTVNKFNPAILTTHQPPVVAPHFSSSYVGLFGNIDHPGDISLAQHGLLFLDELNQFDSRTREGLRTPLQDGIVNVSRASGSCSYPARFMLVGALNPCKCTHLGDPNHACSCTASEVRKYKQKISGALIDRVDMVLQVSPVPFDQLNEDRLGESSEVIGQRVIKARQIQEERFADLDGVNCNADMTDSQVRKYCHLNQQARTYLINLCQSLGLSARARQKILKMARTVADLAEKEHIETADLAQVSQWRARWETGKD